MKYRKFILFSFLLLTFCVASFGQTEQSNEIQILESKPDKLFNLDFTKPQRLDRFFYEVFSRTYAPAGIVFAYDEDTYDEKHIFQPQTLVLKDVLDSFVNVKSEYSWSEANGVINVFPKDNYSILNTRISEFKIEKATPDELYKNIIQTTEFQSYIKEKNLVNTIPGNKHGFIISLGGRISERVKVTIDLKNATVREILNEAVRQRGDGIWFYREYKVEDEGIIYNFYRFGN